MVDRPLALVCRGPIIGLMVPLLLAGNRSFGVSSCMRHLCAATVPGSIGHFRYDWKSTGLWNLIFLAGIFLGGGWAARCFRAPADRCRNARGSRRVPGSKISGHRTREI